MEESKLYETFVFSRYSKACFLTGLVLLAALLILELIIRRYFRKHYEKLIGEETSAKTYFEQLSTIEQKQWLAEETYFRSFNIKTLSDEQFQHLRQTSCQRVGDIRGIYNYNITSNPNYQARLNYQAAPYRYFKTEYGGADDYVTQMVYGAYRIPNSTEFRDKI